MDSGQNIDVPGSAKDAIRVKPLTIGCFVLGEDPQLNTFEVKIQDLSKTEVCDFKVIVADAMRTAVPPRKLQFFKVHVEEEDLPRLLEFLPGEKLVLARSSLSRYWTPEELSTGYIHLIVELPSTADAPKSLLQPEEKVSKVIRALENTQLAVIATQREKTSSGWAEPSAFRCLQSTSGHIKNGRPENQAGLPIGLYHSVFNHFSTNLLSSKPIPASFYALTRELFWISQEISTWEPSETPAVKELLGNLIGESFTGTHATDEWADGMITGNRQECCILLEIEDETVGGDNLSNRAAISYSKYWGLSSMDKIRIQSCCPSLLIAVAGPWICILGAVFLDHPVVQPLTDFIWLGNNPHQPSKLLYAARVFYSLSLARQELQAYYGRLTSTAQQPGRFFPYLTHYVDSTNRRIGFSYTSELVQGDSSKLIFVAGTQNTNRPKDIVVKFVRSYNSEAHVLLAEHGLAPRLLYDGLGSSEGQLGSDLWMIVMDFVPGVDLDRPTNRPTPDCVLKDVERAIKLLHDHDFVFGDLRRPNVMVVSDENGNVTGGMLVDFDWCGKDGEGVYPVLMNQTIEWAAGMEPEMKMYKHHDDAMFRCL